jgi:YD repeat-containing protein
MIKTTLIAALLAVLATTEATAQQSPSRAYYDAAGRRVGSATTDGQGTTTFYDDRGRVVSRESKSGTIYDARGRNVGRFTTAR